MKCIAKWICAKLAGYVGTTPASVAAPQLSDELPKKAGYFWHSYIDELGEWTTPKIVEISENRTYVGEFDLKGAHGLHYGMAEWCYVHKHNRWLYIEVPVKPCGC